MIGKILFGTLTVLALAAPGHAAVIVIGNSSARLCYEAAEARLVPERGSLQDCDSALADPMLDTPDYVATLINRGILRMRTGAIDAALTDFDAASARNPQEPEAYLNKGMALLRRNESDSAIALFETALAKRTRRPALAYYGRAVANEMKGRVRDAYLDYREASRIEPKWQEPKVELARFTIHKP
jgi:tetratricopeptide (TPR) repeat protein